jgi:hypothetical protein
MRRATWVAVALLMGAGGARAEQLQLNYSGVAAPGSSLGDTFFPVGSAVPVDLHLTFDAAPTFYGHGIASYTPLGGVAVVGGTPHALTGLSDYVVWLIDATNPLYRGFNFPALTLAGDYVVYFFAPAYSTKAAFDATLPGPAVFPRHEWSWADDITLPTASGDLVLYYQREGVSASITAVSAVPEPPSLALLGAAAATLAGYRAWWLRASRRPTEGRGHRRKTHELDWLHPAALRTMGDDSGRK